MTDELHAARERRRADVRERARRFATEEVAPHAAAWDRAGAMPRSIVTRLGELGFLAGPLPREHGGSGWDNETFVGVYEELGRADSSVRGFLTVHAGLVSQCLADHGSDEQRRRWLPRLATGEAIGCYALTEEGAGSDVSAIATRARREDDTWILDGDKTWITNGGIAQLALVFARTSDGPTRESLSCFVVELPAAGFTDLPLGVQPLGHRASDHARLQLRGVRVPDSQRLGNVGGGNAIAMSALDHGRLGVAAGAVGLLRGCLDAVVAHARERKQFGHRIGDFQMVQADIADMSAEGEAAAALVLTAARAADQRDPQVRRLTSSAKLFATEAAQRAADKAVLLLGNRGYGDGWPVERHYRDIQGLRIYEGTNHIHRLIIARQLLGPP
ncbi:MAG TPA: acyl-CoA dehydrogenase family protein [Planctomycetota bacterium]|nr:acyl-CoA dehydrogenase family protein [Planctomycetota bacterium]